MTANRENKVIGSGKVSHLSKHPLPPLNALRAFEVAARWGGFQAAGQDMHVSANAIGRQVRLLEDWLGITLFRRLPRGVALTQAGRTYQASLITLMDGLAQATADLMRRESPGTLTVSAMPSFAARWLIPRLGRLTARRPGLDVRVLASVPIVDFDREPVDVAIRLGLGTYPGLAQELLLAEDFFPVCSPDLAQQSPGLKKPADLAHYTLLHDEAESRIPHQLSWGRWLAAINCPLKDAKSGLYFSFSHMTLQAAIESQGVALASSALVEEDLRSGKLIRPFGDLSVQGPYAFRIVYPESAAGREKVALFRDWALSEVAGTKTAITVAKAKEKKSKRRR